MSFRLSETISGMVRLFRMDVVSSRKEREKSVSFWKHRARRLVRWTGFCSVLTGALYLPWLPWYVLGGELEAEITLWGLWAVWGGVAALAGSFLLHAKHRLAVTSALMVGLLGMALFALGQVLPVIHWLLFWGQPITEGGVDNPTTGSPLYAIPHVIVACLAMSGIRAIIRAVGESRFPNP